MIRIERSIHRACSFMKHVLLPVHCFQFKKSRSLCFNGNKLRRTICDNPDIMMNLIEALRVSLVSVKEPNISRVTQPDFERPETEISSWNVLVEYADTSNNFGLLCLNARMTFVIDQIHCECEWHVYAPYPSTVNCEPTWSLLFHCLFQFRDRMLHKNNKRMNFIQTDAHTNNTKIHKHILPNGFDEHWIEILILRFTTQSKRM